MKNIRKDIEIRRFIEWSKIVRGKPIQIRLYELIYFELLNLWIELKQPSLRRLIYETINSNSYFLGLHRYKTINIEFGFNPTDRITTLECKNCGHTKLKADG